MTAQNIPNFASMDRPDPNLEQLEAQYDALLAELARAQSGEARYAVIQQWEKLREDVDTWGAIVSLHFHQDTADAAKRARRDTMDAISPRLTNFTVRFKKALLALENRENLTPFIGTHCFALWEADARTFDESIEADLAQEAKLCADYTELRSSAKLDFQGETHNLSSIGRFLSEADRQTRYDASRVRWNFFEENKAAFDDIYDQLVKLRTQIAHKLGYPSFIELAYDRMNRTEYNKKDVEVFRNEVRDYVVPVAVALREKQRELLGLEKLMAWDEPVMDLSGNPKPQGGVDWMVERATEMYDAMHPELGKFFHLLADKSLLDLDLRATKAGGGFCTGFPTWGVPFVFANFNGTKHDVTVLTHEMGHAFQFYASQDQPIADYFWPTMEACEIHSMSLEFLCYPWMDKFFGDDADRFRANHLADALLFLPYGAAVDHFQHLVYENPDATPAERNAMWQHVESLYLPDRDYGDLPHCKEGGLWQQQLHIYEVPFYYIDYALAQSVALQFWDLAEQDFPEALNRYVALCRRGGSQAFNGLVASADLRSPFESGCLAGVVETAKTALALD